MSTPNPTLPEVRREFTPMLMPGDVAPWFTARCTSNNVYHFNSVAGRYIVLCFFGSAAHPLANAILTGFVQRREVFDDTRACFFGVSVDPEDESKPRVREILPGYRWFWDFDRAISRMYGATRAKDPDLYQPHTLVLDERQRVIAVLPFEDDAAGHVARVLALIAARPAMPEGPAELPNAPVLAVPRVFEPGFCKRLIDYYKKFGGGESGVMRDQDGLTVGVYDNGFKRRRDQVIEDEELRNACIARISRRLVPQIEHAFAFKATRIERHIVACYDAQSGGFFKTMLHEATPMVSGTRYAYLPFLYDDAAAKIREATAQFIVGGDPAGSRLEPSAKPG